MCVESGNIPSGMAVVFALWAPYRGWKIALNKRIQELAKVKGTQQ